MALSLFKKRENTTSSKFSAESGGPLSKEAQTGMLVTFSIGVLFALLFGAGQFPIFDKTVEIPITFNYISGLEKNAPVFYAGHKVGKISDISFLPQGDARILVKAAVSPEVVLKKDSEAYIDILGFMGEKLLEITPGTAAAEPLKPGETLRGTDPVPMMKIVKQGRELLQEFEKTTDSMNALMGNLETIVGDNQPEMNQIFQNLNSASENLKDMTHDLKLHPWKLLRSGEKKKKFLFF